MAINTDSYMNIVYSGTTVTRIGLSKALSNYTLDELYDYVYCAFSNRLYKLILERQNSNINTYADTEKVPYVVTTSGTKVTVNNGIGIITDERGDYQFIVWLQGSRSEAGTYSIYQYQLTDFKLITEWDAPNYYYKLPDPVSTFGTAATSWSDDESTVKTTWSTVDGHGELFYRYVHGGMINDISLASNNVYPYAMFKHGSRIYLKQLRQNAPAFMATVAKGSDYYTGGSWIYSVQPDDPGISVAGGNFVNPAYAQADMTDTPEDPFTYYYDEAGISRKNRYSKTSDENIIARISYNGSNPAQYLGIESFFSNKYQSLLFWAACGIKFYADKLYKPIIKDGYVEDFTDNLEAESDLDNWSGDTKHTVPVTPPSPPVPSGDDVDDMTVNPLFGLSSDAGFATYYLITASQLATLHTWLTTTAFPDGYDPYSYIISLVQFPLKLSPTWCLAGTSGSIHIGGEDTGITASVIGTEQTYHGLGTFYVPRLNENFLDYDPYTQYEVYIPCCGWVTVPDIVAGHQIVIRINYDLTDASIIGNVYVKINGDSLLIASKSGMMGRQTVVTGEAQGVKSAQITSALLSAGTGALNVATGIISGNAVAAVSGGYNIVAGLAQANIAGNSSYTRSIGSTGGRALLCQYDKCYVKITTTRADIPSNYGHTIGYICNKPGKVSDFSGFSVFDNVDTSGISGATERERQLIKRILETGVIINAAPSP